MAPPEKQQGNASYSIQYKNLTCKQFMLFQENAHFDQPQTSLRNSLVFLHSGH